MKRWPGLAIAAILGAMTIGVREAPATVAEQRARLPPAAECESPVAGRWKALIYSETSVGWYDFVLEIRQDDKDPTRLSGMIYVDSWDGDPKEPEPPARCIQRQEGKMVGFGTFINGEVSFEGREYELVNLPCGYERGYNPDHFTGRLEPERHEFQSVNNDGGTAVNEPTVFRRIGCLDDEAKRPSGDVKPPPFFPKKRSSGC